MKTAQEYFQPLAAAFIRGKLQQCDERKTRPELFEKTLEELSEEEQQALMEFGLTYELPLHRFKKKMPTALPRVYRVLGILKGIQPESVLDIGSGRGAFLWPLIHTFPALPVTCVDMLDFRVADIMAAHEGGMEQVVAQQASVLALPFESHTFDVVTMLEVLEHIPDTAKVLAEVCRVARRFLLLSVPSKEDDNPEHIHVFEQALLKQLLQDQGVTHVSFSYVRDHMLVLARMEEI